ncbi:PadR family transcriptional regulator [Sporolactobacillus inulinus]|uniref:PadR family transcriptional regulator n=1 Tax=Sporolactobacillus inulinus CASD TaxID=1069536 RepID=A0A0U1QPD6_9BACL|nr:PadR family transcriptional regulator [Sporolactobacillus inulinus]KLI02661.1 hypothetical protein SINU_06885 [Sporolactobacillus inulinus CASD]GEB77676.1 PadR family transcriptional regulator [Sporolactobacillus inulinus]
MKTEEVVLGILHEKPRTGYEIVDVIKTIFSHFFDGSYGSIYPVPHKLEKSGKVNKNAVVQEGKPNKNIYSITELGKKEFSQYLYSPVQEEVIKSDFLMRLYFGADVSDKQIQRTVNEEIARKERLIDALEQNYRNWADKMSRYQKLCYTIGIRQYRSEIALLKESRMDWDEGCDRDGSNDKS